MSAMAQLLIEKRKNVEGQYRALLDAIEKRSGDQAVPTAEERTQLENLGNEMDGLRAQSDSLVKFENDNRAAEETLRSLGHRGHDQEEERGADISGQFRALFNREIGAIDLRTSQKQFEEARALSKGTAGAGGNTVPTTFETSLYEHLIETATLLRAGATVLNTSTGENLDMPVTTSHGTAALVAESGTIPQADPVFGKRTLGAYKYGDLILVPRELLTDTAVDLTGYLSRQAGRAVGNALGAHLVTGTGTSQPAGISVSTTLGKTGGTGVAGAPTFDDLIDLLYSVIAPYRNSPNAAWLIKDTTAGALRKLKDTSGRYLWESTVTAGIPDRILGYPVLTDPYMPATGLNNKSVIFGDLSTYYVRLVNGIRFERSDDFRFDTDQVAFRCLVRGDGLLLDQSGAVKHFVGAAS
jgi:HK97 family phage major capsid protein